MASSLSNYVSNYMNLPYSQKVLYPINAAKNVYNRLKQTSQYTAGAGGIPTASNLWNALQPQTAYASDTSQMGSYAPNPLQGSSLPGTDATGLSADSTTTDNSGDTGTTTEPFIRYLNGTQYTDPIAFTNAVTQASIDEFNRQNKLLTDAYNAGLLDFGTYKQQIEQARQTVKDQYGQAMGSISGRFSALSPDAYQSSQGTAENRAQDITNQNYANINEQEANLGLQRSQYEQDYANKLAANQVASQNQIDQTVNSSLGELAGTQYANSLGKINAPKLNTMTPMDNTVLGAYDDIAQLSQSGNIPAARQRISELNVEPSIKDWLYTRFTNTVGA